MARVRFNENFVQQTLQAPASLSAGANNGATWVDASNVRNFVFDVQIGASAATSFTVQITQAKDSSGTGSKAITNSVYTGSTSGANQWVSIETMTDHLDMNNGYRYVNYTITPVGGAMTVGVKFIGMRPSDAPVAFGADNLAVVFNDQ